jgi:hypothetical protein
VKGLKVRETDEQEFCFRRLQAENLVARFAGPLVSLVDGHPALKALDLLFINVRYRGR